ncbi:MAG: 50S ribosomal protein L1, partial [Candidatus Berkelbacteria bacterium]|nr:50S ribosomal protein L1 [Candidatus Berkelbacteria bacterium]
LVKKTSMTKFDGNVEVHIRILGKNGKPEQVRGLLQYPHSTGKKISIVILDDRIIDEIEKTKKVEADIYLTTPAMMPKVAKLAKILGPKGKMPNPKAGTITADPEKTMKDMSAGQVEYKTDNTGNIHQVIGKVSGKVEDLEENLKELISVLPTEKIVSANLCATMGPAVKVTIK